MTSAITPKTIELHGNGGVQHEAEADGVITPGMFCARGTGRTVSAGTGGLAIHVANEMRMLGRGIDDDYADGETVISTTYPPGCAVYALADAGAAAIAEGDPLSVTGGYVAKAGTGDYVVAQALEAVDNSAGADPARVRAEIINGYTAA